MALDYKKLSIEFDELLDKFFREHTNEEIQQILNKYDVMDVEGPTVEEYLVKNITDNELKQTEVFICQCHSMEHQSKFWYDKENDCLYIEIHLITHRNIWYLFM